MKKCEHGVKQFIFGHGEDAPGKPFDSIEQCLICGAVIHWCLHGGGQTSPNYPRVYESPLAARLEEAIALLDDLSQDGSVDEIMRARILSAPLAKAFVIRERSEVDPKAFRKIIVNGREHLSSPGMISYEAVISIAYPGIDTSRILSVTYSRGAYPRQEGILAPKESVRVVEGMRFAAYDTSNA